jgi:hypothetical protein
VEMGVRLRTARLQVDPGLVGDLLAGAPTVDAESPAADPDALSVRVRPGRTLNAVSTAVEAQYFLALFRQARGDFGVMAERLLGDPERGRAIRLRFNQLGLKVRDLRDEL